MLGWALYHRMLCAIAALALTTSSSPSEAGPPSQAPKEHDLAASASLLRALQSSYDEKVQFTAPGNARKAWRIQALQDQVWKLVATPQQRAAATATDNAYKGVNFDVAAAACAGPSATDPLSIAQLQSAVQTLSGLGEAINEFRSYSKAFADLSNAGIGDFLSLMASSDPFRLTKAGTRDAMPLDTIEGYQRQIDQVIASVEQSVPKTNQEYRSGYKVDTSRRLAVYREVVSQYKERKATGDAAATALAALKKKYNANTRDQIPAEEQEQFDDLTDKSVILNDYLNSDRRTVDVAKFVSEMVLTTTNEIMRSARGRTESQNQRDKVKEIDAKEIEKELEIPH
jgi:hypothetical protein